MKRVIWLFFGILLFLPACAPGDTVAVVAVPNDKLAKDLSGQRFGACVGCTAELHSEGTLKKLSLKYQEQDLTQEAARYDVSALSQLPQL